MVGAAPILHLGQQKQLQQKKVHTPDFSYSLLYLFFFAAASLLEMFSALGAHAQRGLLYLVRVCACVCACVRACVRVRLSAPFQPLRVNVSPENDTNASSRQDKENQTGDFL